MDPNAMSKYEEAGLTGLVRAGEAREWFFGHFGAALVSGAALLRDGALPEATVSALTTVLDRLVSANPEWFSPLDDDDERTSAAELVEALAHAIGTSRTSGHPTIYAVAGLRCLARRPERATRRVVKGLISLHACAHENDDRSRYYGFSDYFPVRVEPEDDVPALPDVSAAIREGFVGCRDLAPDADVDGRRYFFAGEKIHLVTHAHALDCLLDLGHPDLACAGLEAERLQLKLTRTPEGVRKPLPEPSRLTPFDAAFWENDGFDVWHKLKLAEASVRLLPRLTDGERVEAERVLGQFWSLFGIDREVRRQS